MPPLLRHNTQRAQELRPKSVPFFFVFSENVTSFVPFPGYPHTNHQEWPKKKKRGKKKEKKWDVGCRCLLSWLFCFVVDPVAWVCIHGQFLRALPVRAGMCARSPTPIGSIVHSTWLSLTHTASCLRGSHEPVLPPRKETFVTHRPVSHHYTVQTLKKASLF